jgi:predicted ATPase
VPFDICLLGVPQALSPTGIVHFRADKRYQFLAYLAYKNDWVSRDELAHLFWSDVTTEVARHSLRQLIKRLKVLSLPRGLEIEHERLRWQVASDVKAFKQALQTHDVETARQLYRGDFLTGLESGESNEFHVWLFNEREALKMQWQLMPALTPATPPLPKPTLAVATTTFIGRDKEREKIAALLKQDDCRLVTLLALGGMGKTRLALQLAKDLEGSFEVVYFVELESVTSAKDIPFVMAEALGLETQGQDVMQPIIKFLKDKHSLLIFDNYEHLMEGVPLLAQLLQHCTNLKLLVTSRERLNLEEEWLYQVQGLDQAEGEAKTILESDAAQLFLERTRRVNANFYFRESDATQFLELCQRFSSSPLALELAAPWLRVMSFTDLAQELAHSWEMLENSSPIKDQRQQSLRAVFEHSWQLLAPKERDLLQRLSVFHGGFTKEAASSVAGATVTLLAVLLDKSLLRSLANGRYDRHPLVYQYALEKLAENPDEERFCKDKHGDYFLGYVVSKGQELLGPKPKTALHELETDLENIRRAWNCACEQSKMGLLEQAVVPFSLFLDMRVRFREAIDLFGFAETRLDKTNPKHQSLLAAVFIEQGFHYHRLSDHQQALSLVERGLSLLHSESETYFNGLRVSGSIHYKLSESSRALEIYNRVLTYSQATQSNYLSRDLRSVANVQTALGRVSEAETNYRAALVLDKKNGYLIGSAIVLNNLASLLIEQDRLIEAKAMLEESLGYARDADLHLVPYLQLNLAEIAYKQHLLTEAERQAQACLHLSSDYAQKHLQSSSSLLLARIALQSRTFQANHLHHRDGLLTYLHQAAQLAQEAKDTGALLEAVSVYAQYLSQANPLEAAKLLRFVATHPSCTPELQKRVVLLEQSLVVTHHSEAADETLTLDTFVTLLGHQASAPLEAA